MRKRRIHQFLLLSPFLPPSKPKKRQPKTSARSSLDHAPIDTVSYVISLVSTFFFFSTEYHLRIDAIISGFMHRHRNTLSRDPFSDDVSLLRATQRSPNTFFDRRVYPTSSSLPISIYTFQMTCSPLVL